MGQNGGKPGFEEGVRWSANPKDIQIYVLRGPHTFSLSEVFGCLGWVDINQKNDLKNRWAMKKEPGWLGYIGDFTTQVYRDYIKPL